MPTISFQHVSKRFVIQHNRPRAFQDVLVNLLRQRGDREEFWALRDVSFDIEQGETVGIIGQNGSGKSTALKLMTRILEPTWGDVEVKGKVSALLELGAGFHPELSGRENVYLNASILGLPRREMDRRFDEIVEFAELADRIDTPLKHYSTGMQMRLAFAVAVNVDPDVLLIDEVLAVGDEAFQHKCMERLAQFKKRRKTIVLVSHDLGAVERLCGKAIWLDHGVVRALGRVESVVDAYLKEAHRREREWLEREKQAQLERERAARLSMPATRSGSNGHSEQGATPGGAATGANGHARVATAVEDPYADRRRGTGEIEITAVRFLDQHGREREVFQTGDPLTLRIEYVAHARIERPVFGIAIFSGPLHINGPNTRAADLEIPYVDGPGCVEWQVDSLPLLENVYQVSAAVVDHETIHEYDHHDRLYDLKVMGRSIRERYGVFHIPARWRHEAR